MKDFVGGDCGYCSLDSQNMQVNHFVARFKHEVERSNSFIMDNLGNLIRPTNTGVWKIYDTFEEMLDENRAIISTGDQTHLFSYLKSLDVEGFAVRKIVPNE